MSPRCPFHTGPGAWSCSLNAASACWYNQSQTRAWSGSWGYAAVCWPASPTSWFALGRSWCVKMTAVSSCWIWRSERDHHCLYGWFVRQMCQSAPKLGGEHVIWRRWSVSLELVSVLCSWFWALSFGYWSVWLIWWLLTSLACWCRCHGGRLVFHSEHPVGTHFELVSAHEV